ncbi:hypothetical protein GO001_25060 [Streptomyces sp. NRRL B-1677]|uniref:hypothetical protein n=1 Tax=Streptomyces TaxID=1883 RepID=UPI001319FA5C|nr:MULTISPECIES: hypothetical protein [Streptomyces]MBF6048439.1 hypothetical protein [Streptomyces sp. NRRL B-1677]
MPSAPSRQCPLCGAAHGERSDHYPGCPLKEKGIPFADAVKMTQEEAEELLNQ